ncbi:Autophagy protein 22 [Borealophlyctis nickersoniae]|nr:Autophagy protein 22 [Borealophlyctis nickersoniae]
MTALTDTPAAAAAAEPREEFPESSTMAGGTVIKTPPGTVDEGESVDTSTVTPRELKGWWLFGFAAQGFTGLALDVFSPIILQSLAAYAGYESKDRTTPCNPDNEGYDCGVYVGSLWVNTTSLVLYAKTLATLTQAFVFISLGALADYGARRKTFLIFFAVLTAMCGYTYLLAYKYSLWWLPFLGFIFGTIFYGSAWVFEFAWLPILSRYHPDVVDAYARNAKTSEIHVLRDRTCHRISAGGIAFGGGSAFCQVIIGAVIALTLGQIPHDKWGLPKVYALQIAVAFSSTWLLIGLNFPRRWLKARPGPPLPAGENYLLFSWKKLIHTIRRARRLSTLFRFLIGWFMFSDAFNTILAIAILFFQADLGIGQTGLLGAAIVADFCQAGGVWVWVHIQRRFGIQTKNLIVIQASLYSIIPLWGLLGFLTGRGSVGLQNPNEIWALAAMHGFMLGGSQSSCRVLFSELLPQGMETQFFSLYAITENGSAWIGPLVVAAIGDVAGNRRYAFFFILFLFLAPIPLFWGIDAKKGKAECREFLIAEGREVDVLNEDGGEDGETQTVIEEGKGSIGLVKRKSGGVVA